MLKKYLCTLLTLAMVPTCTSGITTKATIQPQNNVKVSQEKGSYDTKDWSLTNVTVTGSGLRALSNNGVSKEKSRAIYNKVTYNDTYEVKANVMTSSHKNEEKTQILFNYFDDNNYYYVQFGGGDKNTVELKKIIDGNESVIATLAGSYSIYKCYATIEVTWESNGLITVRAMRDAGEPTVIFNKIEDKSLKSGKIGFGTIKAKSDFDNVQTQNVRDPFLWPFSSDSIWNMPIGSNAKYVHAGLEDEMYYTGDEEYIFKIDDNDPVRNIYGAVNWLDRDSNRDYPQGSMKIADDILMPDSVLEPYSTPNNCTTFIQPDGRTLLQLEPFTRTTVGGDVFGWRTPDQDIYSQGIYGSHYGTLLSSLGGSIRKGELVGDEPIRHALKIEMQNTKYHYWDSNSPTPGYTWPATRTDGYLNSSNCKGTNPVNLAGALYALPPELTPEKLGVTTPAGKKIFKALQDYGAYDVDDTGWSCYAFGIEKGVQEEFSKTYGYSFSDGTWSGDKMSPYVKDIQKIIKSLHVVVNNGPESIGGGGTPREAKAPNFMFSPDIDTQAPIWNNGNQVTASKVTSSIIELSWPAASDNKKVAGYNIYCGNRWADFNWGETSIKIRQIVTTALKPDTEYTFIVKAVDAAGNESVPSTPITVRTLPDTEPPTAPSKLSAAIITDNYADINWKAANDNIAVTAYDIYNGDKLINSVDASQTKYTIEGLSYSTEYSFTVKARDAENNVSEASNTLTIKTSAPMAYTQNFSNTAPEDWEIDKLYISGGELKVSDWAVYKGTAIYKGKEFSGPFTYKVSGYMSGSAVGNQGRILFNYKDDGNYYMVRLTGSKQVELVKVVNWSETVIASYNGIYDFWGSFCQYEVNYGESGTITVKSTKEGVTKTLFDNVKDNSLTSGYIGIAIQNTNAAFDNVVVTIP